MAFLGLRLVEIRRAMKQTCPGIKFNAHLPRHIIIVKSEAREMGRLGEWCSGHLPLPRPGYRTIP